MLSPAARTPCDMDMQAELEHAYAVCLRHRSVPVTGSLQTDGWSDACEASTQHFATLARAVMASHDTAALAQIKLPVFGECMHEVRVAGAWVVANIVGFHGGCARGMVPKYCVVYPARQSFAEHWSASKAPRYSTAIS